MLNINTEPVLTRDFEATNLYGFTAIAATTPVGLATTASAADILAKTMVYQS